MERYGDTPEGMVASAVEYLEMCRERNFDPVVVSLKSSNVRVMVQAYRLLAAEMRERGWDYPLHLGVTEAGDDMEGRIKSAVGIGALLADGLGDTIRVSLTEAPEREIPVARQLADYFVGRENHEPIPEAGESFYSPYEYRRRRSVPVGEVGGERPPVIWNELPETVQESVFYADIHHVEQIPADRIVVLTTSNRNGIAEQRAFFLAARVRISKAEYISCPSCGRTLYDLEKTLAAIKARTSHLKGIKIGVMGCIVNGPGEMADADYGYVGAGPHRITLYRGKEVVRRNIPQDQALDELVALLKADGKWQEP